MLSVDHQRKHQGSKLYTGKLDLPSYDYRSPMQTPDQMPTEYGNQQLPAVPSVSHVQQPPHLFLPVVNGQILAGTPELQSTMWLEACDQRAQANMVVTPPLSMPLPYTIEAEQYCLIPPTTGALRGPVFIPASMQSDRDPPLVLPSRRRRMIVHGAVSTLSIFILMSALMAVIPSGIAGGHRYDQSFFQPLVSIVMTKKAHTTLIAAQAATATAVTQDGYDPGGGHTYAGVQAGETNLHIPPMDWGSLNRFFYGQCTYWANMRYHIMTGHWIPWLGNAYQWAYQAPAYGWAISSTPNPNGPSIVILAPYAQGAGAYGHVAIVEKVNRDGSVVTSNWNWNGRWASESWVTFYPGRGVTFVWYPG